jgi:hypothetical protein
MAWSSGIHGIAIAAQVAASHHPALASTAQFDAMMLFGCASVVAAGVSYRYRLRSRGAMLAFAASIAATGLYGFAEGAWPLGIFETAWAILTTRRALLGLDPRRRRSPLFIPNLQSRQSRYREVYGSN